MIGRKITHYRILEKLGEGEGAKQPSIHIVENWFEEFKDRQEL